MDYYEKSYSITSFPLLSICSLHSGNWYKLSALEKTLWRINDDRKVDSSSIIEKLKSELQQHHVNMYNAWEESGFDINSNSFDGSNTNIRYWENKWDAL